MQSRGLRVAELRSFCDGWDIAIKIQLIKRRSDVGSPRIVKVKGQPWIELNVARNGFKLFKYSYLCNFGAISVS